GWIPGRTVPGTTSCAPDPRTSRGGRRGRRGDRAAGGGARSRAGSPRPSARPSSGPYRSGHAAGSTILGRTRSRAIRRGGWMDIKGKRLRLLFSDVLGVERGKYLFGDVADAGHSAFCVGVFPLTTDKEILDVSRQQFDVGLPDVEAFIDRDTLRPGWEEDTIVGIADVQQHGKALEVDPREVLRRAVEPCGGGGLAPLVGFEPEV